MRNSADSTQFAITTLVPRLLSQCICTAVVVFSVSSIACGQISAPSSQDTLDSQFLTELNSRQLYDLAADYAQERVRRPGNVETQAFWIGQLSAVYQLRTWQESSANRQALAQQAVETITSFLTDNTVKPETDLALRLNQIEVLLNLANINQLLHTVGHRGPRSDAVRAASADVLPLIDQGTEHAEALLKQLRTNRGQLDSRRTSMLRERGSHITVALAVLRYQLSSSALPADTARTEQEESLRERLKALTRAARMPKTRQAAELMLAEMQIAAHDFKALNLTLRKRDSSLTLLQQRTLAIRSMIRQGNATEALQQSGEPSSAEGGNELSVLQLESLLLLKMQADDLQDTELQERSDDEFARRSSITMNWGESVWKDAAIRIIQRYHLVETVGAKAATLVEHVESLRVAGQLEDAFLELQRALRLLPLRASSQSQAAIHLRMGELLIAQKQWEQAIPLLQRATELFGDAERPAPAASAALLEVFCIGQQWRLAPQDESLKEAYFNGLVQHRNHWKDESTYQQSTEWLVQLTQQIDPLFAADVLAQHAANSETMDERLNRLNELGEHLESARSSTISTRTPKTWAELVDELQAQCKELDLTTDELTDQSARLLLLQASLTTNSQTSWESWNQLHPRLERVLAAIADIDPVTHRRLNRLLLLTTARTSTDTATLQHQQKTYFAATETHRLMAAQQLATFLSNTGRTKPGDGLIATTIEQLLTRHLAEVTSPSELSAMLSLTPRISRVTGNDTLKARLLDRMFRLDLTSKQTTDIATVLMMSGTQSIQQGSSSLKEFWKRIHSESEEGNDLWLESCLQLARIQAQQDKQPEAVRQLRVTSVIYPEWGSVDRRQRVDKLLREWQVPAEND